MCVIYNFPRKRGFHDYTFLGVSLVMRQETTPGYGMIYRVPTHIVFSNSLCFSCFPALPSSSVKMEIFTANIEKIFYL